jgi:hypothetical protein
MNDNKAALPEGLPETVRIGWRDYTLIPWSHREARNRQRFAEHDGGGWEIRLDVTYPSREVANSLLHELLHALYSTKNVLDADDEERTVTGLAHGLTAMWRDNPGVFAWMHSTMVE